MASTVGNTLSIEMRVFPPPMSWIVTCTVVVGSSVFGLPSSLAKPFVKDPTTGWLDLPREHGFEPLDVEGTLPDDLVGTRYRNGPSFFSTFGRRYQHWFDGDRAVFAVLRASRAAVRLVQSQGLQDERAAGRALTSAYGTRPPGNAGTPVGRTSSAPAD